MYDQFSNGEGLEPAGVVDLFLTCDLLYGNHMGEHTVWRG